MRVALVAQSRYTALARRAARIPRCGQPHSAGALTTPTVLVRHDGATVALRPPTSKGHRHSRRELRKKPDSTRDMFYLAQSYRDAEAVFRNQTNLSTPRRDRRAGTKEVWYSLFQVAVLSERLNNRHHKSSANYLAAFQCPSVACRVTGRVGPLSPPEGGRHGPFSTRGMPTDVPPAGSAVR